MSRILSRLVLASSAVLATPVAYLILFIVIESRYLSSDDEALIATDFATAFFFVVCWILVWRSEVSWTNTRVLLTILSIVWSTAVAGFIALLVGAAMRRVEEEILILIGGMVWMIAWMASTALIWRETGGERADRLDRIATGDVNCLECGYNMTGLHEARCPECGAQYTLDQLVGAVKEQVRQLSDD